MKDLIERLEANDLDLTWSLSGDDLPARYRAYFDATQKLLTEAALALRSTLGEGGWRPIETAPRDGTHILIRFGSDWTSSASYHRDEDDAHPWKFLDSQGQGLPIINGARDDKYGPSHWMPLPLPNPPGEKGSISSVADTGSTAIEPKSDGLSPSDEGGRDVG